MLELLTNPNVLTYKTEHQPSNVHHTVFKYPNNASMEYRNCEKNVQMDNCQLLSIDYTYVHSMR